MTHAVDEHRTMDNIAVVLVWGEVHADELDKLRLLASLHTKT